MFTHVTVSKNFSHSASDSIVITAAGELTGHSGDAHKVGHRLKLQSMSHIVWLEEQELDLLIWFGRQIFPVTLQKNNIFQAHACHK